MKFKSPALNSKRHKSFISLLLNCLGDKSGSILTLVIMVGAVLFIIVMALLTRVNNTTVVNTNVNHGESAYLAAKTGLNLVVDKSKTDSDFAKELYDCRNSTTPIKMDFSNYIVDGNNIDLGKCEIYPFDMGTTTDASGNEITKIRLECHGLYEDKSFVINRYVKLKKTSAASVEVKPAAFICFEDSDLDIKGGIEGDVFIMGNGTLRNEMSATNTPMHDVVSANGLSLGNSGCIYNLIASGRYVRTTGATIKTDVYVGEEQSPGVLYPNIYFYLGDGSSTTIGGSVMCEGDVIFGEDVNAGQSNWDTTVWPNKLKDSSKKVIISRGKVYIGYKSTHKPAGGYTLGSHNPNGPNYRVYGGIIAGDDIHIAGTTDVYGDIICNGTLYIEGQVHFNGNIYAKKVEYVEGNQGIDAMFPNNITINSMGDITTGQDEAALTAKGITLNKNMAAIPELTQFTNGTFVVGASAFFDQKIKSSPKPITNFPVDLDSSPVVVPVAGGVTHITGDCKIEGAQVYSTHTTSDSQYLYIDTAENNTNIDVYLKGSVTTDTFGCIVINDNAGNNQVRIFMEDGSTLRFKNSWGSLAPGILVIGDSITNIEPENIPTSANDGRVDMKKVPQLYLFGREGKDTITLDVGAYGYIPGYVIMPYINIQQSANGHTYKDGAEVSTGGYPYFYGMVMCHSFTFKEGPTTFIKYNKKLDEKVNYEDPVTHVISQVDGPTKVKFNEALSRDGVITYNTTPPGPGPGPNPTGDTYSVDAVE